MEKIKGIIFDLDDTLLDTTKQIKEKALKDAISSMIDAGMKCTDKEGFSKMQEILKDNPAAKKFTELAESFGCDIKAAEKGQEAYDSVEIKSLETFPGTIEMLKKLKEKYELALISTGRPEQQEKKIELLGIRKFFDIIIINQKEAKEERFARAIRMMGFNPQRIMCIGDRIDVDVKAANRLGMISVRMMKGGYKELKPRNDIEKPDFTIDELSEIPSVISRIQKVQDKLANGPTISILGGGTGTPTLIEGLKQYTHNINAIITITDRGRSSGKLHDELKILPPGDIRNCIVSLSDSEEVLYKLFQYRFEEGGLEGHSFGNLMIAALTKITGDFGKAIKVASKILNLDGGVYPSTLEETDICAELEDGTVLNGEQEIVVKGEDVKKFNRPKIKKAFISPEKVKANKHAVNAILDSDIVIIGPGSLYTSVVPNLLIKDIKDALKKTEAKVVYICNIMTQVGQTDGFTAYDHVKEIEKYAGKGNVDYAIINSEAPPEKMLKQYEEEGGYIVENDKDHIEAMGIKVIDENLLEELKEKKILWNKQYLLRHNSHRIAEVVMNINSEK